MQHLERMIRSYQLRVLADYVRIDPNPVVPIFSSLFARGFNLAPTRLPLRFWTAHIGEKNFFRTPTDLGVRQV